MNEHECDFTDIANDESDARAVSIEEQWIGEQMSEGFAKVEESEVQRIAAEAEQNADRIDAIDYAVACLNARITRLKDEKESITENVVQYLRTNGLVDDQRKHNKLNARCTTRVAVKAGQESVAVKMAKRLNIKGASVVSIKDMSAVLELLRTTGHEDLLRTDVNTSAVQKFAKKELDAERELPVGFEVNFDVSRVWDVRTTHTGLYKPGYEPEGEQAQ